MKSFSLALGLLSGLSVSLMSYVLGLTLLLPIGVIFSAGLVLLGLLRPKTISPLYRLWNLGVNQFARAARLSLMGICFYIILFAVRRAGKHLELARPHPGQSLWTSKDTFDAATYLHEFTAASQPFSQKSWCRSYVIWARTSGHAWALLLVPFLAILSALEIYHERPFPAGLYTLF